MPAPPLSNTFEGGTNTTVITVGNSGAGSGDAFSTVNGVVMAYSSTQKAHGALSAYSGAAQTVNQSTNWTGLGSLAAVTYFRMYLYLTAWPAVADSLFRWDVAAGTRCGGLAVNPSGFIFARDASNANIGTAGTATITRNQWVRLEVAVTPGAAANGTIEWRIYQTADSVTADDDVTRSGATLGANLDAVRFGFPEGTSAIELYWDDVAVSTTGWIGPAVTAAPGPSLIINTGNRW